MPKRLDTDQHLFVDTSRIRRELGYEEVANRGVGAGASTRRSGPTSFDYAAEDAALASLDR